MYTRDWRLFKVSSYIRANKASQLNNNSYRDCLKVSRYIKTVAR